VGLSTEDVEVQRRFAEKQLSASRASDGELFSPVDVVPPAVGRERSERSRLGGDGRAEYAAT
jgi:hypothetical protein